MNPEIFRAYDIRGIAATDLTDPVVENIGQALATLAIQRGQDAPRFGVGRDARSSSTRIFEALQRGLHRAGAHVVNLGVVPTPLVYFATFQQGYDGSVQITGSHNPGEYNGFKMMIGRDTLHGETIQELLRLIEDDQLVTIEGEDLGTSAWAELRKEYIEWIRDDITMGPRKLHIAMDSGNGVAGVVGPELLRDAVGARVTELYTEPDGTFPNHHPDPTVAENLEDLIATVREEGCDFGVAYDGDGDRIGVVDEEGTILWGDQLLIVFARQVLQQYPGATVIGEVKCSQTLFDAIERFGGEPVMARVGHSLIKAKIKETGAKLAGEMSGHIFFNDRYFGFDDALYATCRLAEIVSHTNQPFSALLADIPSTFATAEVRRECDEAIKFDVPIKVSKFFADDYDVNTIDGVRVNFNEGWGLVRASNTQPVVVLRAEGTSPQTRDRYMKMLEDAVANAEQTLSR